MWKTEKNWIDLVHLRHRAGPSAPGDFCHEWARREVPTRDRSFAWLSWSQMQRRLESYCLWPPTTLALCRGVRSFVTCSGWVDRPQHALCTSTDVKITSRRQRWFMMREGAVMAGMCGTWVTAAGQRAPVPAGDQGGDTWPQLPVRGAQVPMVGLERLQRCCRWQCHK